MTCDELGGPRSADLLATIGDHRRLIEIKSQGRHPGEALINDLLRHLNTWSELRPESPVGGGALVVNHQHRLPPDQRTRAVYTRPEFVASLTVPVIPVHDLFDWWKTSNSAAIQRAILGTDPPSRAGSARLDAVSPPIVARPSDAAETPLSPEPRAHGRRRWFGQRA